jgi:hypothetical protein
MVSAYCGVNLVALHGDHSNPFASKIAMNFNDVTALSNI